MLSPEPLVALLNRLSGRRVAVVGDLMLDRYIWGKATRISREAPVPVVHVRREDSTPGGAANVVRNLAALGADTDTFGVIGDDGHGRQLLEHLQACGSATDGVIVDDRRPTTVKTRVFAGVQQVVRVDREEGGVLAPTVSDELAERVETALRRRRYDAVILEDYAKGVLTPETVTRLVSAARRASVPVSLDPHAANRFCVHGLCLLTPNRAEAFQLAGLYDPGATADPGADPALAQVGQVLCEAWDPDILLITLGAGGMAVVERGRPAAHIATRARDVFDVSGAGDTVMATAALALAAGGTAVRAAELANHAAGLVVAEVGTAAVQLDELRQDLEESS